jgi:hypothetical protein
MALRISTGLRNFLLSGGSLKRAFEGGRMEIYSGTQPASADTAVSGTLLCTITTSSAAHTAETPATGSIQITGGSSGNISAVTIDSVGILDATVTYNTSINQTASDLAAALNRSATNLDWVASASTDTVTLTAKPGCGTRFNGKTLATTTSTITTSCTNPSGGAAGSNGLRFEYGSAGALAKRTADAWTGVAAATGTAGYFRLYSSKTDAGGTDSSAAYLRMDGAIATSGAQLNMNPTSITSGATQTISSFSPTVPASL